MLLLVLVGCSSAEISNDDNIPQAEVMKTETIAYNNYILTEDVNNSTQNYTVTITTERIHENMPEFTFIRTISNSYTNYFYAFPMAAEVSIEIKDEKGSTIQVITGLTQSIQGGRSNEITFGDYNFDGYMDMRLTRWQDSATALLLNEYFWLWDNNISQFVLSEQLINKGSAAGLIADSESRQIVVGQRIVGGGISFFFEWQGEELLLVGYEIQALYPDDPATRAGIEAWLGAYGIEHTHIESLAWQEAYAEVLRYYYTNVPMPEWLEYQNWSFFLHDMVGHGTPTLFIVYFGAGIWSESIYHFVDGEIIPIEGSFFAYWGIVPPVNRPGIIIQAYGLYDLIELGLDELSIALSMRRPFMCDDEGWYINGVNVSEDEFTEAFRDVMPIWYWDRLYSGDRTNIFPSNITEANIQKVIGI